MEKDIAYKKIYYCHFCREYFHNEEAAESHHLLNKKHQVEVYLSMPTKFDQPPSKEEGFSKGGRS